MPPSTLWCKYRIAYAKRGKSAFLSLNMRPRKSLKRVAILNPEHLFEQAENLRSPPPAGRPRQADIRRAISTAYYGVFHATVTAAADQFVGVTKSSTSQYGLVYRSVDHGALRTLCEEVKKPALAAKYAPHGPLSGFGPDIAAFASAVLELQQKRHAADYAPLIRVLTSDAIVAVRMARAALTRFNNASPARREAFLSLLLFPPRR
jgi:hypothetical protein